ncbi:MAG: RiPP maturation radical SAM C-methyltransferase, partial [Holophagales bacterium]|nr:RiPP maturation radical SAM C-methyltransferase [Holophagales bacterium]
MRIALIVMPFASANQPSLAVGLLKAALHRQGIPCDIKHFHLTFWRLLGQDIYRRMAQEASMASLAGEWVFSQVLHGESISTWDTYRAEVLDDPILGCREPAQKTAIREAVAQAPAFLRLAYESNDWSRYDVVGFTSTFEQTLASLCLAERIKARHPRVRIVLGGANFEAGMGRPYLETYPFVDFISIGEADLSFPELCRRLEAADRGEGEQLDMPPGFLYRDGERIVSSGAPHADGRPDLDTLPIPDFDDYFRLARAMTRGQRHRAGSPAYPRLPVEASRGCWWGQKAHCKFCGLNGETMAFRRKSWRRVAEEIETLEHRYGELPLQFADNILAMDYFRDLLPHWANEGHGAPKFFEIKANLERRHLRLLGQAGVVKVQPGIESLADATLAVMQKGVTAAQNVALLRWCAELGLDAVWNVIYGFPHAPLEDIDQTFRALRRLTHLPPPGAIALIRMDRFSPNHSRWRQEGFTSIEPAPAYRHIFPMGEQALHEAAYYFRYEHPGLEQVRSRAEPMEAFAREWQQRFVEGQTGGLAVKPHVDGGFVVSDHRFNYERRPARRLEPADLALLAACGSPVTRSRALRRATAALEGNDSLGKADSGGLEARLDELISA